MNVIAYILIGLIAFLGGCVIGHISTQEGIAADCNTLGKVRIVGAAYECKKITESTK